MSKSWKVTTSSDTKVVQAYNATVTPTGHLLLSDAQGLGVHYFASGTWTECEIVRAISHDRKCNCSSDSPNRMATRI